jgi:tetratricopeptide (TPR) repeat protein
MTTHSPTPGGGRRLQSWKEIASYFGREVRTVQRWERSEGLPIHRHRHRRGATVHAYTAELEAWSGRRAAGGDAPAAAAPRWVPRRRPVLVAAAALAVASALAATLSTARGHVRAAPAGRLAAARPEAREQVLRGQYLLHRGGTGQVREAVASFERAVVADPSLPEAHAGLAQALEHLVGHGAPPAAMYDRAAAAAREALRLDPGLPAAHTALAHALFEHDRRLEEAEAAFRRALALDPGFSPAHRGLAQLLSATGRHQDALAAIERARLLEPLSASVMVDAAWFYFRARRFPEAIAASERVLALEPRRQDARFCIADSQARLGDLAAARATAATAVEALGDAEVAARLRALPPAEALAEVERWHLARAEAQSAGGYAPPFPFAIGHAKLGDAGGAARWLERARQEHDLVLLLVEVHPAFDAVRDDPRVRAVVRAAGLEGMAGGAGPREPVAAGS